MNSILEMIRQRYSGQTNGPQTFRHSRRHRGLCRTEWNATGLEGFVFNEAERHRLIETMRIVGFPNCRAEIRKPAEPATCRAVFCHNRSGDAAAACVRPTKTATRTVSQSRSERVE